MSAARHQSLFNEDGIMRLAGTMACLIKTLKEKTKVVSVPDLQREQRKTAVVEDAMYAVRRWSFHNDETFGVIARRYTNNLVKDVPAIIHFCCDRCNSPNLNSSVQQHRYARSQPARLFEVREQCRTPDPQKFCSVSANKVRLLSFICEAWNRDEQLRVYMVLSRVYLGGGFTITAVQRN